MSKLIDQVFRGIRRLLESVNPSRDPVFARIDFQFSRAQTLVRFYYLASMFIAYEMMPTLHTLVGESPNWSYLWPVAWLSHVGDGAIEWVAVAALTAAGLAFQFPAYRVFRILFAFFFLCVVGIENSQGAMDHSYHAWLWLGISFMFLPSLGSAAPGRAGKMAYLSVIAGTQALILLFYTFAGFWKFYWGAGPLFHGVEGNFAPRGLALQLAGRILETGTKPLLGDFVITNYWLSYPMFLVLIFMQLTAVFVVLRPRLHIIWGYALIVFHIGTWLLMEIYFPVHVLLLGLLFVMSPFRPQRWTLREVLCDLPVFGFLIRKLWRISAPAKVFQDRAYSVQ
jgi:hypothetical protein